MVASGALSFDGKGWFWERPLVWLRLIKPELFTIVIKSLTYEPRKGNLRWWKPWDCVRLISGGSVNKVGLTNKGIWWWFTKVAPRIDFKKYKIVGSIFGTKDELVRMTHKMNKFPLVALEINVSCPNASHEEEALEIIATVISVARVSRHPIILKLSANQDYVSIAKAVRDKVEAFSLNSVPWGTVFTKGERTPLWKLEKKVGGGGGGVSGRPAQKHNWKAVEDLSRLGLQVIGPSVMEYEDMQRVRTYGAQAVSFGAIHLRTPWKPTSFVKREMRWKTR